ncbi:hypothetical protein RRG08_013861 [Elysia crispata]|uniref:Uncharacterized protein n=1 Tax=Elysia crispata TaxID=231223 RepID=A0AAE0YL77_9GAST|nr:hypothetical protein RRG08_013861 [Elysia crispata]
MDRSRLAHSASVDPLFYSVFTNRCFYDVSGADRCGQWTQSVETVRAGQGYLVSTCCVVTLTQEWPQLVKGLGVRRTPGEGSPLVWSPVCLSVCVHQCRPPGLAVCRTVVFLQCARGGVTHGAVVG